MSDPIKIQIQSTYEGKGSSDALKAIAAVEKATVQAAKSQAQLAAAQSKTDAASAKSAQSAARVATAQNQAAISAQKLAQAESKTAADLAKVEAAQTRAAQSALRLQQANEKAAKPPGKGLTAYFDGIKNDAMNAAAGMVAFGAALQGAQALAQSFQDAFNMKAQLDASTASINIQLKGVRDTGQVWNEAAAYATKYKLTQQQTAATVQASIGILRTSNATVADTFSTLQRLTVLSPGKTIEEAAFSVRELASGDIISIADQFNIGKDKAYEMRDAIAAGADPIATLSAYLDSAGISMDTLKVQTEGVVGAQKDAAIAAEQLALAQAEWASGPGMAILQGQIGLTRELTQALNDTGAGFEVITDRNEHMNTSLAAGAGAAAEFFAQMGGWPGLSQQIGDAVQGTTSAFLNFIGVTDEGASATQEATGAAGQGRTAFGAYAAAAMDASTGSRAAATAAAENAAAMTEEAGKAVLNQANTQALAIEKERLAAMAQAAAGAVLAAGGNIESEAARLAASSSLVDKLTAAFLRLAIAQGQAGGAARIANQAANTTTYGKPAGNAPGRKGTGDDEISRIANAQAVASKAAADADAARAQQIATTGTAAQKAAQLQQNLTEAVAKYGAGSAQAIQAETALIASRQKGGAAAGARANAEAAASDKIVDLARSTAAKLAEIDEKRAAQQIAAQRSLANEIASSSARMIANQEANDLGAVGASEDQLPDIIAREEAEKAARLSTIEAVQEAKATAAGGDAELAQEQLKVRQEQIQAQQSLDEEYAKKKVEFADDPALTAALQQQYDEATAANQAAAQVEMDLASQVAAQKIEAMAAEKQAVLDDANARAAAMDSTGKNAATAQSRVDDLAAALASLPTQVTSRIDIVEVRSQKAVASSGGSAPSGGGSSASSAAAGGMDALTSGPTTIRVGDNPGGVERVTVTPLSGKGSTRMGPGLISMAGGGVVDVAADDAIARLRNAPGMALPAAAKVAGGGGGGGGGSSSSGSSGSSDALKEANDAIELLSKMAELRAELARIGPPIDTKLVNALADEAMAAAAALGTRMVKVSEEDNKAFGFMADSISDAIGILSDVISLRNDLLDIGAPIDMKLVNALADEALGAAFAMGIRMKQVSEQDNKAFGLFGDSISDAISVLSDAASLRNDLVDIGPPLDETTLNRLAFDAQQARRFVIDKLIPTSEETAEAISLYTDSAGAAIGLLTDASKLTADLFADYRSPTDAQLQLFTQDSDRITRAVATAAATYATGGLEAAKAWAEATGAVFGTIDAGLVTFDKLRFSDITVDTAKLAQFTDATSQILTALGGLGNQATALPNLAPLTDAANAYNAVNDSLITAAAVPYGNLGQIAGNAGGGGSSSSLTINIINPPANMNVPEVTRQITAAVKQNIATDIRMKR